jgi:hypothetical protein
MGIVGRIILTVKNQAMKRYLVYANLDRVTNFLVNNSHGFKFETYYDKPLIELYASPEYINDMKEVLATEGVYPVFYE